MSKYSNDFKLKVVEFYLKENRGIRYVADYFNISSKESVRRWVKKYEKHGALKKALGRSYNKQYLDYVFVNPQGRLIRPDYITQHFSMLLEKIGMKHIRFHDLRHSCASLLLAKGIPMKAIQEWLGHSNFSTTANLYAHLDVNSKKASADALVNALKFTDTKKENE